MFILAFVPLWQYKIERIEGTHVIYHLLSVISWCKGY